MKFVQGFVVLAVLLAMAPAAHAGTVAISGQPLTYGVSLRAARAGTRTRLTRVRLLRLHVGDRVRLTCPRRHCVKARTLTVRARGTLSLTKYVTRALSRGTDLRIVVTRTSARPLTI